MTLLPWLLDNPAYGFAALVGLCVGIFYGFDGWRGDTTDLSLQESPRVKNLIWVLGPGVVALVGDVRALDPDAKKTVMMLSYFLPCVAAGFAVVGTWGIVVGASRIAAAYKGQTYGYGFGDALGDYFFYGYRYYRMKVDEAKARFLTPATGAMPPLRIALFLDVDLTITEETIQDVYARELGVKAEYDKLENDYRLKTINSAQFGRKLIALFASKNFSRAKAEELFHKVDLKSWVDQLFTLQDRGVAIYLVSAGPSYYIDVLRERKKIPKERTIRSIYYFDEAGVVSKCDAIEDDQKTDFVLKERRKYDITIGIGDNDLHDKFVSVCTIAMLTTVHSNYVHLPNFNAVFLLVDKLLQPRSPRYPDTVAASATTALASPSGGLAKA
jgi:phosphoserine phosphatase